ncbi:MAG TPA: hypothetical protein VHE61_07170 [Opitutaceae bacterium]|nr:hypothetical protein [Opitutaceae bacterium]
MRSIPLFGLGIFFALAGVGLFAFTLRKPKTEATGRPMKKSALREQAAEQAVRQAETGKLRIAAAISVVVGAALMMIS